MEQDLARISCVSPVFLFRSSKSVDQFLRHMPAIAHGHQANNAYFLIHRIDDAKAAHAILPEPYEFPLERIPHWGSAAMARMADLEGKEKGKT